MSQKTYGGKSCLKRLRSFPDDDSDTDRSVSPVENKNGRTIIFVNNNTHTSSKIKVGANNMMSGMGNEEICSHTPKRLEKGFGFTRQTRHLRTATKHPRQLQYRRRKSGMGMKHITHDDNNPNVDGTDDRDVEHMIPTYIRSLNAINNNTFEQIVLEPGIEHTINDDNDLETDVIYVRDVKEQNVITPTGENFMNQNILVQMNSPFHKERKTKQPDAVDEIFITHPLQTDNVYGDRFGAQLVTYSAKDHASYNQHFLCHVTDGGPAYQMDIKERDELILINDAFVPNLTHTDVLNLFHKVKVDSKTRFKLVIRRYKEKKPTKKKKQWVWYKISAILVPEEKESHTEQKSTIQDPVCKPLENNRYELKSRFRFNVQGTQLYLDISSSGIRVEVLNDDNTDDTKNIIQWARYQENPNTQNPEFVACLCGNDQTSYVAIDMTNTAVVSSRPTWFQYRMVGSSIWFRLEGTCSYLGCDRKSGALETQPGEVYFERVPLPHDQDCPDDSGDIYIQSGSRAKDDSFGKNINSSSNGTFKCNNATPAYSNINDDVGIREPTENGERLNTRIRITRSMSRQMSLTRQDLCFLAI